MTKFQDCLKAYVEALRNGDDHDITNAAVDVFDNWDHSHEHDALIMEHMEEGDGTLDVLDLADNIEELI
jgi:hypothetical protein